MTDEQLILKYNELKNQQYNGEHIAIEDIHTFTADAQASYNAGEITKQQLLKYAELTCYLSQ